MLGRAVREISGALLDRVLVPLLICERGDGEGRLRSLA